MLDPVDETFFEVRLPNVTMQMNLVWAIRGAHGKFSIGSEHLVRYLAQKSFLQITEALLCTNLNGLYVGYRNVLFSIARLTISPFSWNLVMHG
jgi:hypothetical protein